MSASAQVLEGEGRDLGRAAVVNKPTSKMLEPDKRVAKRATPARRRRIMGEVFSGRGWGKARCRPRRDVRYVGLKMGQKRVNVDSIGSRIWCQSSGRRQIDSGRNPGWAFVARGSALERRLISLIADDAPVVVTSALKRRQSSRQPENVREASEESGVGNPSSSARLNCEGQSHAHHPSNANTVEGAEGVDGLDGLASLATQELPPLGLSQSSDGVEMLLAASDYDSRNHRGQS